MPHWTDGSRNLEQRRLENWLLACIRIEYPVIVGPNILIGLASPLPDLVQVIDVNMAAAVRDHRMERNSSRRCGWSGYSASPPSS
jgi:hypothetical protein